MARYTIFVELHISAVRIRHLLARCAESGSGPGSMLGHIEGTFITESQRSGLLRQLSTSPGRPGRMAWRAEEAGKADLQGRRHLADNGNRLDSSSSVKRTALSRTVEK